MYKVRVANSFLVNFNFGIGLQCRVLSDLGEIFEACSQATTHQGSPGCTL